MSYTKHTWVNGEILDADKMNHLEDGVVAVSANGAIGTANLADNAVTSAKIADGAVTTDKIAAKSVTRAKLSDAVTAELDNKANIDGSYESMTVGNAEQLVSSVGIEEQTPYNFRTSGGSTEIGDREELNAVVGATVAWNQLVPTANRDFTSESSDTRALFFVLRKSSSPYTTLYQKQNVAVGILSSVFASSFDGYAEMTHSGSQRNIRITPVDGFRLTNGHKYLFSLNFTSVYTSTVGGVVAKDISVFDLTLDLGSTIADYIYALEQSNAGAGVAYFRKLFPKPYYAYNSGALLSVRTSAHKMVGFNQWDEEWEVGGISATTGENTVGTASIRAKNKFRILPNTVYHLKCSAAVAARYYDANDNYLASYAVAITANSNFTTPSEAAYMRFQVFAAYGTTYNHDICINLSWDGERNGEYEPYQQWNYPLDSSLTLRGILKLDANNNLYADGDRYLPDGTVERRYGIVTLNGSESTGIRFTEVSQGSTADGTKYVAYIPAASNGVKIDGYARCDAYLWKDGLLNTLHVGEFDTKGTYMRFVLHDQTITTLSALNTYLASHPLTILYELATPTTEAASPYQQTQIVDDFGTEEFVDAAFEAGDRDVAIPVGNETVYKPNLRAKLEMAPDSPDGDGDYIVRQTNGQNTYIPLVDVKELPDFPSNDGLYKLRCTVTNGTATLSWASDS